MHGHQDSRADALCAALLFSLPEGSKIWLGDGPHTDAEPAKEEERSQTTSLAKRRHVGRLPA